MIAKILIRAPQELKERLQNAARKHGFTLNQFVLQILWDWDRNQPKAGPEDKEGACCKASVARVTRIVG